MLTLPDGWTLKGAVPKLVNVSNTSSNKSTNTTNASSNTSFRAPLDQAKWRKETFTSASSTLRAPSTPPATLRKR